MTKCAHGTRLKDKDGMITTGRWSPQTHGTLQPEERSVSQHQQCPMFFSFVSLLEWQFENKMLFPIFYSTCGTWDLHFLYRKERVYIGGETGKPCFSWAQAPTGQEGSEGEPGSTVRKFYGSLT